MCECTKTTVKDSRPYEGVKYRKRKCPECGYVFFTEEQEMENGRDKMAEVYKVMQMGYRDRKNNK